MGVLLHLQTMEESKLEMLGQEREQVQETLETLELGMEFLKAASTTSSLAARYVTMLQSVRNQGKQDMRIGKPEDTLGAASARMANIGVEQTPVIGVANAQEQMQMQMGGNGLGAQRGEIDLDGMNFDDFLFGIGLPQDVLSFDYPNNGFLL
jgi:hypothetical protein